MNLFDVYTLWNIEPVRAKGCRLWDKNGPSIWTSMAACRHFHRTYPSRIYPHAKEQIDKIGFYSNSVINSLQQEVADKLGKLCGYPIMRCFCAPEPRPTRMR